MISYRADNDGNDFKDSPPRLIYCGPCRLVIHGDLNVSTLIDSDELKGVVMAKFWDGWSKDVT